jgi:hypothetical protein
MHSCTSELISLQQLPPFIRSDPPKCFLDKSRFYGEIQDSLYSEASQAHDRVNRLYGKRCVSLSKH